MKRNKIGERGGALRPGVESLWRVEEFLPDGRYSPSSVLRDLAPEEMDAKLIFAFLIVGLVCFILGAA